MRTRETTGTLVAFAGIASLASSARATGLVYRFDGGNATISGNLGGTAFSDATWSLSGIGAGPETSIVFAGMNSGTYVRLRGTKIRIQDPNQGKLSAFLRPGAPGESLMAITYTGGQASLWGFLSFDPVANVFPSYGAFGLDPDTGGLAASLSIPGTYAVPFDTTLGRSWGMTLAGNLTVDRSDVGIDGQLSITRPAAVPEPGAWAALVVLGTSLAGLVLSRRRTV